MPHLEDLISEYLDWQGFLVRRNRKVGRLKHGGWEMELDLVGYRPASPGIPESLVHYEPSIDALSWERRETRYQKKIKAARKYIFTEVFPWLGTVRPAIQHYAVFINHPKNRHEVAGFTIISIDELMATIRAAVDREGIMSRKAIPEQYPLLRTLQLSHSGYHRAIPTPSLGRSRAASA